MTNNRATGCSPQKLKALAVHIFTASSACFGLMTLIQIHQHHFVAALWFMALALFVDAIDGTLARWVGVKIHMPNIDGALLDNLVDYLNYVITPCFFLFVKADMLPVTSGIFMLLAVIMTSSYQFCQADAKTDDHFFKGFPCYWNIVVFYMFIFNTDALLNFAILGILCVFIFIPIKYVYPSRLDNLTESPVLKKLLYVFSAVYGICSLYILWSWPSINTLCMSISILYILIYIGFSFYRTFSPSIIDNMPNAD